MERAGQEENLTGTEQKRQERKRGTEQDRDSVIIKGIPFSAVHFHFQMQPSGTPHVNINY